VIWSIVGSDTQALPKGKDDQGTNTDQNQQPD